MEWQACEDQELADLVTEHASHQSHQFAMFSKDGVKQSIDVNIDKFSYNC